MTPSTDNSPLTQTICIEKKRPLPRCENIFDREACFHKLFCHLNLNTCWHNETANDKQLVPKLMSIYIAVQPLHTLHFSFITQQCSLTAAGSAGTPSCPLICRTFVSFSYFSSLYFVQREKKRDK